MFSNSVAVAAAFTLPVAVSTRTREGTVTTGCGSYILLNNEGWVLTAAHVLDAYHVRVAHKAAIENYEQQRKAIEEDTSFQAAKKRKLINKLECKRDWLSHVSFWWGSDGVRFDTFHSNKLSDVAVLRLTGLRLPVDQRFPKFGDPNTEIPQGRSLCRLGFPFHTITSSFDEGSGQFQFAPGSLPIPRFPLDGILTRHVQLVDPNVKTTARFIELSTPGLRGQSGGPVFDVNGTVWGVQSQTRSLELGFRPSAETKGKKIEENQFLNVGWAAYVSDILKLLDDIGVSYGKA